VFLGVALPQVSSCGIAFAFALQGWGWLPHPHDSAAERLIAFGGSLSFAVGALLVLSWLERRGRGFIEGRTGVAYAMAGAWSILLLLQNPLGEHGMLELLRGQIVAVSNTDLLLTAVTFSGVVAALLLFHKEFLLVSYDREMAVTLGKSVLFWDAFLFTLIGFTISASVLTVGPLVTFGFLLLPPLIAYPFAANTAWFLGLASLIGGVTAIVGYWIAYVRDLPVGPTDLALMGAVYAVTSLGRSIARRRRRPAAAESETSLGPLQP
jgi:ABC-type Mn2+/Zn2+ transport system permease subunit